MNGFRGCLLRIDLTEKKIYSKKVDEADARKYLGGRGLGAKILFEELRSGIDPLGPENKLLFMTGPLAGIAFPGNSRYCVMAKSPLTGLWGESHAAGYFASQLKWAGFDGIIFEGVAEDPVYLWIHEGEAEIKDAKDLWRRTTHETEDKVKEEINQLNASVASIGIGGENLVRFAGIINDSNRAAGRTGLGAVMGSKKLKAIAAYGKNRIIPVAEPQKMSALTKRIVKRLFSHAGAMSLKRHGTASGVLSLNEQGILPTKNFQLGVFCSAEAISGETMTETILKSTETCYACPLACKRITEVKDGPYKGDFKDGPEYETIAAFGSLCMNDNLPVIAMANHLCNLHSLDTISTGNVIAFAMECYEKGIITEEDTEGVPLRWGNPRVIIQMIERIARRESIGDILAEGVRLAADRFGHGASHSVVQVKGLEAAMHEPRGKKGLGLAYATSCRGAVHLDGPHDTNFERDGVLPELNITEMIDRHSIRGKAELTKKTQDLHSALNSIIICRFVGWPPYRPTTTTDLVNVIRYVTGWDFTVNELMKVGERNFNISRAFNVREGATREDDRLPPRFTEAMPTGASAKQVISNEDLRRMLDEYYTLRGWDMDVGLPTEEKLEELDLQDIIRIDRKNNRVEVRKVG